MPIFRISSEPRH